MKFFIFQRSRKNIFISWLLCLFLTSHVLAQQLYTGDPTQLVIPSESSDEEHDHNHDEEELLFESYQKELMEGFESKLIYTEANLIKKKRDLQRSFTIFSTSDQKIQQYYEILQPLEQQIESLQEQLDYINEQTHLTEYKISNVTDQIISKQEEIRQNMEDIDRAKIEAQYQERTLMEYVKLIYSNGKEYYDQTSASLNDVKLLLSKDSLSKTISSQTYLQVVQKTGQNIFEELQHVHEALALKELDLEVSQERLAMLKNELERQRSDLSAQQQAKNDLLTETRGQEAEYRRLIFETEEQKKQSANDIELLQDRIGTISEQLRELKKQAGTVTDSKLTQKAETTATLLDLESEKKDHFPWPVVPERGLSAYFKDSGYVKAFGVDHGALDIPVPQSSDIHAIADSVVFKAQDNGYGYSYIILAHRGGLVSLYGHVSKILVKEGQLVREGDVIGLSGGAPGTKGAGRRTTGAHLHLEIWKDGKKVDPLLYMDLTALPMNKVNKSMLPKEQAVIDFGEE